jgi:hypothetical protein
MISERGDLDIERQPARKFQDLIVWHKAHALAVAMYRRQDSEFRSQNSE